MNTRDKIKFVAALSAAFLLLSIALPLFNESRRLRKPNLNDISVQVLTKTSTGEIISVGERIQVKVRTWGLDQKNKLVIQSESTQLTDEEGKLPLPPQKDLEFVQVSNGTQGEEEKPLLFGLDVKKFEIENIETRGNLQPTVVSGNDNEEYLVYIPENANAEQAITIGSPEVFADERTGKLDAAVVSHEVSIPKNLEESPSSLLLSESSAEEVPIPSSATGIIPSTNGSAGTNADQTEGSEPNTLSGDTPQIEVDNLTGANNTCPNQPIECSDPNEIRKAISECDYTCVCPDDLPNGCVEDANAPKGWRCGCGVGSDAPEGDKNVNGEAYQASPSEIPFKETTVDLHQDPTQLPFESNTPVESPFPTPEDSIDPPPPTPTPDLATPTPMREEPTPTPTPDEPTPTPTPDEPTPTPTPDEPTPTPEKDQPTPTPDKDEPTPTPNREEPTPTPDKDQPSPTPDQDEPKPSPQKDEPTPTPTVEGPTPTSTVTPSSSVAPSSSPAQSNSPDKSPTASQSPESSASAPPPSVSPSSSPNRSPSFSPSSSPTASPSASRSPSSSPSTSRSPTTSPTPTPTVSQCQDRLATLYDGTCCPTYSKVTYGVMSNGVDGLDLSTPEKLDKICRGKDPNTYPRCYEFCTCNTPRQLIFEKCVCPYSMKEDGNGKCVCDQNMSFFDNGRGQCIECKSPSIFINNSCLSCIAPKVFDPDSKECVCDNLKNYFESSKGICVKCDPPYIFKDDICQPRCTDCEPQPDQSSKDCMGGELAAAQVNAMLGLNVKSCLYAPPKCLNTRKSK